jgi:hypothetical protein
MMEVDVKKNMEYFVALMIAAQILLVTQEVVQINVVIVDFMMDIDVKKQVIYVLLMINVLVLVLIDKIVKKNSLVGVLFY